MQRRCTKSQQGCSTSPIIRGTQVKSTVSYHLPPARVSFSKKTRDGTCWPRRGEKGALVQYEWKCKLVEPLGKTAWRFCRNYKQNYPYYPTIPLLGILSKGNKNYYLEEIPSLPHSPKHYSQQPRYRNNLSVCLQMNG